MAACEEVALLRQAYLDGELDAAGSVAVERHLAGCAACAAEQKEDEDLRAGLRAGLTYHRAPAGLRGAVLERLAAATEPAASPVPAERPAPRPPARTRRALLR